MTTINGPAHASTRALLPKVKNIAPALLVVQHLKVHQPPVVQTFEPMVFEQVKLGVHAVHIGKRHHN